VPEYRIALTSSAEKEISRLPSQVVARIFPKIESLAVKPRPHGCKKLRGGQDEWRIRVGDYRVIYTIDDSTRQIDVTRVAHRREAYEA
jgi:mRNA interferase RelE/StbE